MKKFSNITGQKVNQEPKIELKVDESEIFKGRVLDLMDKLLTIRTYGPVDRYQRAGDIKIAGKELLAEALIDLLKQENLKEGTKLLEGLKSEIRDWQIIDEKIEEISSKVNPKLNNINKINTLISKYSDLDLLVDVSEKNTNKITSVTTLEDYKLIISESKLPTQTKSKLVEIYDTRIKHLTSGK
jgi:hypothetical protein